MADTPQATGAPAPVKPRFWRRFSFRHFGLRQYETRTGKPHTWGRLFQIYDAQMYGLAVALGVPLMGWLITDVYWQGGLKFSSTGYAVKVTIAAIWFAVTHAYWPIEVGEITDQVEANGLINVRESDNQRRTMYSLYFGVLFALGVWIVCLLWHVFSLLNLPEARWVGPVYGPVEIGILLHTWRVGRSTTSSLYGMISSFQQALAGQMRRETKAID